MHVAVGPPYLLVGARLYLDRPTTTATRTVRLRSLARHDFRVTGCIDVKPGQLVGAVLGGLLISLAAGACFSGEEVAQMETGRMAVPLAILLSLLLVLGSLGSGERHETPKPQSQQQLWPLPLARARLSALPVANRSPRTTQCVRTAEGN